MFMVSVNGPVRKCSQIFFRKTKQSEPIQLDHGKYYLLVARMTEEGDGLLRVGLVHPKGKTEKVMSSPFMFTGMICGPNQIFRLYLVRMRCFTSSQYYGSKQEIVEPKINCKKTCFVMSKRFAQQNFFKTPQILLTSIQNI